MTRAVDVVVLAYGDEPWLAESIQAVLTSDGIDPVVHVVDNGATAAVAGLAADPRVRVITPGTNTGYAGGCNLGATDGAAETLVFVNSDVIVEPGALAALVARVADPGVGLVTGCLLLMEDREAAADSDLDRARVNTVGNPVHWSGFSWCGGFGDPRREHLVAGPVASISGGLFAVRRETWQALGGFEETFFAYHEDVDLSLRCWISGSTVVYEPDAVGWHDYAFSRNVRKAFLVERNRLLTWLTVPSGRTWRRLALPFVLVQVMALGRALLGGDGIAWLKADAWILRNLPTVRRRRRAVQAGRRRSDDAWLALTARRMQPPTVTGVGIPAWVNSGLERLSPAGVGDQEPARA